MKFTLTTALALGLSGLSFAQSTSANPNQYDFKGDPIGPQSTVLGLNGDIWSSLNHGYSTTDGVAPYQCGLLVSPADGFVYHIDETTGAQINAFPLASPNDSWLGYDDSRNLMITANPLDNLICGYIPGNPVPLWFIVSPTIAPVGAAWDSARDEYVYCDWVTNDIVVLSPNSLAVARSFNYTGTLDRMAGVAYDEVGDVYVVGDRDTQSHYMINPVTGAIVGSYLTAGSGTSVPRGAGASWNGGVWTADYLSNGLYEQEAGHGPVYMGCGPDPGAGYCFGDSTGASCPCSSFGGIGQGCANTSGIGATLVGTGSPQLAGDSFRLEIVGVPGAKPGLVLRGNDQVAIPAGDGILCTSGGSMRSHVQVTVAGATTFTDFNGGSFGSVSNLGSTTNFQFWYRDPSNTCSGAGFNFTNGWAVVYQP